MASTCDITKMFLNHFLSDTKSLLHASRLFASNAPNPSSIISVVVLDKDETLINAYESIVYASHVSKSDSISTVKPTTPAKILDISLLIAGSILLII